MATSANLSSIIRYYAEKAKTPFIDFKEFCAYIKKYAEKNSFELKEAASFEEIEPKIREFFNK